MWAPAIATQLQQRGHDVIAVVELAALRSKPDVFIFATAQSENRVIVTDNVEDFRDLAHKELQGGGSHAGLIFTSNKRFPRHDPHSTGQLVRALDDLLSRDIEMVNLEYWLR